LLLSKPPGGGFGGRGFPWPGVRGRGSPKRGGKGVGAPPRVEAGRLRKYARRLF